MKNKLDTIAGQYSDEKGFEAVVTRYKLKEILKFTHGPEVLDLGCGEGVITRALAGNKYSVTGVDGSGVKLAVAAKRLEGFKVKLVESFFEKYIPRQSFNSIVMANILEHVSRPVSLLEKALNWLEKNGRIIATVPNAESLNRRIGLKMGIIKRIYDLTDEDLKKGHLRFYSLKTVSADFKKAGLKIIYSGGIFLKPFPHKLMEKVADDKLNQALWELRKDYPLLCSSLIIVGKK